MNLGYMKKIGKYFLIINLLFTYCSKEPELFPKYFFDLNLTKKITGAEAKEFVNRLHLNTVTDEKNEIGFYNGLKGNAIIYVTFYNDENVAKHNYEKMIKKISPENSVFRDSTFINISGKIIYRTFGMGQFHYVFTYDKKLFWISADINWSHDFINEYLKLLDR